MRSIPCEKESSWRWAVEAGISVKADNDQVGEGKSC